MKNIKYIKQLLLAFVVCMAAVSCMDDDWGSNISDEPKFGNNNLKETNVISIAELKSRYFGNTWNANDTIKISEDVQIKISDYRSNMGAKVFEIGEPFDKLISFIKEVVESQIL